MQIKNINFKHLLTVWQIKRIKLEKGKENKNEKYQLIYKTTY